jgi:N-acetylmuramoyl-L-alanine amidase
VRFRWLLLSLFSIFLFCSPAEAGKILSWQYEVKENRLVFITDEDVQPKAQLLANPTRLVIDLPGTKLEQKTVKETYSGSLRSLRVGQFEAETTRIVVEFAPGYTIDPEQVRFRGISPTQWTVDIPTPRITPLSQANDLSSDRPIDLSPQIPIVAGGTRPSDRLLESRRERIVPEINSGDRLLESRKARLVPEINSRDRSVDRSSPTPVSETTSDNTQVETSSPYIKTTQNGFFISIDGNDDNQEIETTRENDTINFDLEGVTLPNNLASQNIAINQYGVSNIEFTQTSSSPPQARISLQVTEDSPDWQATFSRFRGLVLIPRGRLTSSNSSSSRISSRIIRTRTERDSQTTISAIELADNDTELLIRASDNISADTTESSSGVYEIRIPNAELAEPFSGPDFKLGSPISEVRVRQENDFVIVVVRTRLGVSLGRTSDEEGKLLALPIEWRLNPPPLRDRESLFPPNDYNQSRAIDVPKPTNTSLLSPLPPRQSRTLVVIDAGHGGQDPGTIGIGGLREKDLVLPVALDVAELLRKEGIEVKMTRDSDYFVTLEGRTDIANQIKADLFVSIHANAINLSRPDINGLETYYYQSGRRLAEVIHWSILNDPDIEINDRSIRRARFYVLRHSAMPAVLVEIGFVTGAEDAPRLRDPEHRRNLAEAIARGVIEYIKQNRL